MNLRNFLIEAKINTYASNREKTEKKLKNGGKKFVYKNSGFTYYDLYFGFNPFIGQEIVWKNNEIVWGMNYYGLILNKNISEKEVYNFLKKALCQIKKEKPFRGPKSFKENDWQYKNKVSGTIDTFSGIENIYFKNKKVYELKYYGGKI